MRRAILAASAALVIAAPAAHAGGGGFCHTPGGDGTGREIVIRGSCFTPAVLRVEPGTAVRWVTEDAWPHTITSGVGEWDEVEVSASKGSLPFEHTFDEPGIYPYYCRYHLSMGGAVIVGDDDGTAAAPVSVETGPGAAEEGSSALPAALAGLGALVTGSVGFAAGRRSRHA